jgi:hypothetical protein
VIQFVLEVLPRLCLRGSNLDIIAPQILLNGVVTFRSHDDPISLLWSFSLFSSLVLFFPIPACRSTMQRSETKKGTQQRKKQSRCVENPLRNASSRIRFWKTTTQPKPRCCEISHYLTNVEKKSLKPKVLCPPHTTILLNCFCVCLCVSFFCA